jgi:hypothetical protein
MLSAEDLVAMFGTRLDEACRKAATTPPYYGNPNHRRQSPVRSRASDKNPCPCCGSGSKGCSVTADDAVFCRGEPGAGWVLMKSGDPFNTYRRKGDRHDARPPGANTTTNEANDKPKDWPAEAAKLAANLTPEKEAALADSLGLPVEAVGTVAQIGYTCFGAKDDEGQWVSAWTIPERDGTGKVVGIAKRFTRPATLKGQTTGKGFAKGGRRGVILPAGWRDRPGPVLIPEGASDVLALSLCGLSCIGRPNDRGGVAILVELLRDADREIIVIGENDAKSDGTTPGRDGAIKTAAALAEEIGRPVKWSMPPDWTKDAREWVRNLDAGSGDVEGWPGVGREILRHLQDVAVEVRPEERAGLLIEPLDRCTPRPVAYNVPNTIPGGMLGMVVGEGGHGKSTTLLELAAANTTGRCAFGMTYPEPTQCDVLLVQCEDDWERTTVPRLATLGADLSRVHRVTGVRMKPDGDVLDFHLGHFGELNRLLIERPEIRLVVIDPAGAYVGRSGVNEHKDAELRGLLGPLSELANRTGATIILVKHLNKAVGASAVMRVSGSAGYVNACRFVFMIAPDQADRGRKLFLPIKANVLPAGTKGMAYRMTPVPADEARALLLTRWPQLDRDDLETLAGQQFRQQWEHNVFADADAVAGGKQTKDPTLPAKCAEWMKTYLAEFAYPSSEILAAAADQSERFTLDNVKEAKVLLKDNGLKHSNRGERLGGVWWSGFGDPRDWTLRPEPATG